MREGAVAAEVRAGWADELSTVDPSIHSYAHVDHLTSTNTWIGLILHPDQQPLGCARHLQHKSHFQCDLKDHFPMLSWYIIPQLKENSFIIYNNFTYIFTLSLREMIKGVGKEKLFIKKNVIVIMSQ